MQHAASIPSGAKKSRTRSIAKTWKICPGSRLIGPKVMPLYVERFSGETQGLKPLAAARTRPTA